MALVQKPVCFDGLPVVGISSALCAPEGGPSARLQHKRPSACHVRIVSVVVSMGLGYWVSWSWVLCIEYCFFFVWGFSFHVQS